MMKGSDKYPDGWATRYVSGNSTTLGPYEYFVRCAYNKSHHVLNHKYTAHVRKCREAYVQEKRKENEEPLEIRCRHNVKHQVYGPELRLHEHQCPDKDMGKEHLELPGLRAKVYKILIEKDGDKLTGVVVNAANEERVTEITQKIKHYELGKSEGDEIGDPEKLKEILELLDQGLPVKDQPAKIWWPDPREDNIDPKPEKVQNESQIVSRRTALKHKNEMLQTIVEEDEDDWDAAGGARGTCFDWLKHQFSMKGTFRQYPPYLTRAQRKQFEIDNTERLKYEEGIFFPEDEATTHF